MHSSKLIEIIKVLTPEELSQLDLFLHSPFFVDAKTGKFIRPLFSYLQPFYPDFSDEQLNKEKVYTHLFPGEAYIKGKLDKIMTQLFKTIQQFVIQNAQQKNKHEVQDALILARFYRQKKLDRFFRRTLDQVRKKQESTQKKDKEYFFNQYLIEKERAEYESFYNTRQKDLNLPSTLKNLDIFYVIAKQEYGSWLLSQHKHHMPLNLKDDLTDLDGLAGLLERKEYLNVPLVKVYHRAVQLLQNTRDKEAFQELSRLIEVHKEEIPLEQLQAMQALCRNQSVQYYNEGNREYLSVSFELYRTHLEEGYLYYNGGLLPSTIKNIVALGLKLKEYDWVLAFLEKHKNKVVGTKHKEEVYHFNLASYYFAVNAYDDALRYLSEAYEDWYYHIAARRLEIKIYYETRSVLLDPKLDAFKIYIFRIAKSKLTELQKLGNNHFADLVRQISAPKTQGNTDRIQRLIARIKAKKVIAEEEWLLDKLQELI